MMQVKHFKQDFETSPDHPYRDDSPLSQSQSGSNGPDIIITGYPVYREEEETGGGGGGQGGTGRGGNPGELTDNDTYDEGDEHRDRNQPYYPAEGIDENEVRINLAISHPLTPDEQKAFEAFVQSIYKNVADVQLVGDQLRMKVLHGRELTGADLKGIWAKVDFEIVDNTYPFPNGSGRGEATYDTSGSPLVRFSIGHLVRAAPVIMVEGQPANDSAMRFQSLHDAAHLTLPAKQLEYEYALTNGSREQFDKDREVLANDIAHSLQKLFGDGVYNEPHYGYSTERTDWFDPSSPSSSSEQLNLSGLTGLVLQDDMAAFVHGSGGERAVLLYMAISTPLETPVQTILA